MISDPHPVVRQILVRMVTRRGYEPVAAGVPPTPAQLRSADVLLVESTAPAGRALARTARAANPTIAIISEGATPFPERIDRRGAGPTSHLVKPFTIDQLGVALRQAIAHRDDLSDKPARRARKETRVARGGDPWPGPRGLYAHPAQTRGRKPRAHQH
jgi:DNA-binding NtrC family response regulator